MKTIEVREIIKLPVNQICVNPENPRHDEVIMDLAEIFIMQQLVKTKKDSKAMYKLVCDIFDNNLLKSLNNFTYTQRNKIYDMNKQIKDKTFYEVSCYVAASFEECADYIRTIHTIDTGALPWSDVAIKRFEIIQFFIDN